MSLQLTLESKDDAIALITLYSEKLKTIKQEIALKEREIRSISNKITQLRKLIYESKTITSNTEFYSEKWQWARKIEFVLSLSNRPLTSSEIVDEILSYEPTLERKRTISSVSGTLTTKSGDIHEKDKEFIRSTSESGEYSYLVRNLSNENVDKSQIDFDDLPF